MNMVFQQLRAVPAHDGVRQRRLRPELERGARGASRHAVERDARARPARGLRERAPAASSRAGSSSASRSRARWSTGRRCSCSTSRSGRSTCKLRKQMQLELKRIQRELGTTFVYVTHDQGEALAMSDRIAVMNQRRDRAGRPPREIYEQPATPFVADFIGTRTRSTCASTRRRRRADLPGRTSASRSRRPRGRSRATRRRRRPPRARPARRPAAGGDLRGQGHRGGRRLPRLADRAPHRAEALGRVLGDHLSEDVPDELAVVREETLSFALEHAMLRRRRHVVVRARIARAPPSDPRAPALRVDERHPGDLDRLDAGGVHEMQRLAELRPRTRRPADRDFRRGRASTRYNGSSRPSSPPKISTMAPGDGYGSTEPTRPTTLRFTPRFFCSGSAGGPKKRSLPKSTIAAPARAR